MHTTDSEFAYDLLAWYFRYSFKACLIQQKHWEEDSMHIIC